MKIVANFPREIPVDARFPVVTLGVFDGVHLGHQRILATLADVAAGRPVAAITFDPHPRSVLGPPKRARLLTPIPERLELLRGWKLDAVAILRFDQQIAQTPYDEFVRRYLWDGLRARHLVLGYNVRLGHGRRGDRDRLAALGKEIGYEATFVEAVQLDGAPVSSTRVRDALDAGDVQSARRLLGRAYALAGTVVRGTGRGRVLGMPTANLELHPEKLVPANGVYAVRAHVGGHVYGGALNIGVAPTLREDGTRTVEVHLLDYTGDLYGARLHLELHARLRDERRFASPEELVGQVRQDIEAARRELAR